MCVYIGAGGATLLVEKWWLEHMNEFVELEAIIDSMRVKECQVER